ncbi:LPXTG cell wall anchor domain-containing protein [Bifidobacterium sp. LC6]|uniref:LPXTG cell wall anchor domain-containing protein n=1 Tax=Bifidobacterium colobi TaxID=2809026 RepID=A0ABS5UTS2_9BIFI|nr:LPXTG cell wall anchor domain-containing protein [Bifidobacterium colobi]MBT1174200.1 LPXTG cell wall anchor domain-containing protein [Bifidobacterium colobi]
MKKMDKAIAVLAGLSMMLAGVGTAYADDTVDTDTTPQTTQSQQATANAQADADQAQADQNDQASKNAADTPAADNKEQAAPKAQTATAAGPAISNVEAPSTALIHGADYSNADKSAAFRVTLTGLTPGQPYGVLSSMNYGDLPALGASASAYNYNAPVFTASAATQTVDVFYRGLQKPSSTVAFALLSGDTISGSGDYTSLNGTVVNIFGGVQVKVIDLEGKTPVTLDSQSVEDVGVHTAGLKAHYTVDSALINDVAEICYSTTMNRIYSVNGAFNSDDWAIGWAYRAAWDCTTGAISDDEDTSGSIYTVSDIAAPYTSAHSQTVIGQWFNRGNTVKAEDQSNKTLPASGDIESVIPGLLANTKYGNWGYSGTANPAEMLFNTAKSGTTAKDPASMMYSGIVLTFKDGSRFVPNAMENPKAMQEVKDFTTKAAAKGPVSSDQLTDANKNGVVADNDGKVTAGSTYRVYVDSLQDTAACKALTAKNSYCYWTGYIYSTPKQLSSDDGKASTVRVDKDGKAYVEYQIPSDTVTGEHKIALYDNDGNLLGWVPVTVVAGQNNSNQQKLANTGSSVFVIAFAAVALLIAGASVMIYRRRQA